MLHGTLGQLKFLITAGGVVYSTNPNLIQTEVIMQFQLFFKLVPSFLIITTFLQNVEVEIGQNCKTI